MSRVTFAATLAATLALTISILAQSTSVFRDTPIAPESIPSKPWSSWTEQEQVQGVEILANYCTLECASHMNEAMRGGQRAALEASACNMACFVKNLPADWPFRDQYIESTLENYNNAKTLGYNNAKKLALSVPVFLRGDTLASRTDSGNQPLIRTSVSVERDVATERRLAAERGDASAQYALGWSYANGQGVPEDHREAIRWLRRATEQGNADAQYALGMAQFTLAALGVVGAGYEAYRLFTLAAYQGHAKAASYSALMFDHSYDWDARTARYAEDSEPWVRLVANRGTATAKELLK